MSTEHAPVVAQEPAPPQMSSPPAEPEAAKSDAPANAAPSSATDATAETGVSPRRPRLNPKVDPAVVRPIPNLVGLVDVPAPAASPTPPPAPAVAHQAAPAPEGPAAEAAAPQAAEPAEPPPPPVRRPPPVQVPGSEDLDAAMEAEIAAAMQTGSEAPILPVVEPTEESADADAAEEAAPDNTLKGGTRLKGTVQSVGPENVFVDFGLPMTGLVPFRQFDAQKPPQVGDPIEVAVGKVDETEGLILCNLPRGRSRVSGDWNSVAVGQVVDCLVTKTNKGGLEVTVGSLRGFLPASQVELGYVANLESFVGQKLSAKVTEVNPARRRLIVSRRSLLTEERQVKEQQAFTELHPGQTMTGVVKTLKDYGAFVDIGGVDGFLHIGQISWQRIKHPSDVLQEGQSVEVKILSIDPEKKRISLGLRQMAQNPWAGVETKYAKGTNVSGKVTRVEPFGAFVELEPGVEGLVHISELDHKRVNRVGDMLNVGQAVDLQVLEVEPKRKRISLSLKALKAKPEAPKDEDQAPGKGQTYERKHKGNLKGGIGGPKAGGLFGDPRQFS